MSYLQSSGGILALLVLLFFYGGNTALKLSSDVWLSFWSTRDSEEQKRVRFHLINLQDNFRVINLITKGGAFSWNLCWFIYGKWRSYFHVHARTQNVRAEVSGISLKWQYSWYLKIDRPWRSMPIWHLTWQARRCRFLTQRRWDVS